MADGFLGRWSRRKLDAKEGKAVEAPAQEPRADLPPPLSSPGGGASESQLSQATGLADPSPPGEGRSGGAPATEAAPPPEPPPTLDDVADLTPASDFRRFVARDVAPEVKNAAMKKLFADPHFNVMDRLDTYIDDYSKPDPIPESMLRQLASAQFLGLFRDDEAKDASPAGTREATDGSRPDSVAHSVEPDAVAGTGPESSPAPDPAPDAHADLRLQQDDAPEGGQPGHGAG